MISAIVVALLCVTLGVAAPLAVGLVLPGVRTLGGVATVVAPTLAPHLAIVTALAFVGAVLVEPSQPTAALSLAAIALVEFVIFAYVVERIQTETRRAGGVVRFERTLLLSSLRKGNPDAHVVHTDDVGTPISVAVYQPRAGVEAPLLLFVHGGGWIEGSELDRAADMRWYADRGWLVCSIGYKLASADHPTWQTAGSQVAAGARWAMSNAALYGGDPFRTCMMGDSAGGQLALAYAVANRPQPQHKQPRLRAVCAQYPPVDILGTWEHGFRFGSPSPVDARAMIETYIGGTPADKPERYRSVIDGLTATPATCPVLIISPDRDSLVPAEGVRQFARAASARGADVTVARIPFANHSFDALASGSLGNQASRTIIHRWFLAHLPPPS